MKVSDVLCYCCNYTIHTDPLVDINTNYMSDEILTTRLYLAIYHNYYSYLSLGDIRCVSGLHNSVTYVVRGPEKNWNQLEPF